jgi:hypothetical protein
MRIVRSFFLVALFAAVAAAQVKISRDGSRLHVEIDDKPFGDLYVGNDVPKPYFAPLRSASGKIVTRRYPMEQVQGESRDHQHHRGLWLGYIDVNGFNFWENEFSYNRPNAGRMVTRRAEIEKNGGKSASIHALIDWIGPAGQSVLTEDRTMTFYSDPRFRTIDFDAVLTATEKAVFADDKDGALGIRVADAITEKTGNGVIIDSQGRRGMKQVWGKRAEWVDYSGSIGGEPVGIAIFDHPTSFHHPARWHARDYGLIAANPFADHAYDPKLPVRHTTLKPGESIHLRYRIVVHPKMNAADIEGMYKNYAAMK